MTDGQKSVTVAYETLHAISNNLAVILGYVDLLISEEAGADSSTDPVSVRRDDLVEIRRAAATASELLKRTIAAAS